MASFGGILNYAASDSPPSPTITVSAATTTLSLTFDNPTPVLGAGVTASVTISPLISGANFGPFSHGHLDGRLDEPRDGDCAVERHRIGHFQHVRVAGDARGHAYDPCRLARADELHRRELSAILIPTPAPTTATVTADNLTVTAGNPVFLSGAVSSPVGGTITGNIQFCDEGSSTVITGCTAQLNSTAIAPLPPPSLGSGASFSASLSVGPHNIHIRYPGAGDYAANDSAFITVHVLNPTSTAVNVPASATTDLPATFSVNVSCPSCGGGAPSIGGTVQLFLDGSSTPVATTPATLNVVAGTTGNFTIAAPSRGVAHRVARYSGTSSYGSSDSAATQFNVKSNTTTTITAPADGSTIDTGVSTSFTATVAATDGSTVGQGVIEIWLSGGSAPIATSGTVSGGTASASYTFPDPGSQQVFAKFVDSGGSAGYVGSQSSTFTYAVKSVTTLTMGGNILVTALDNDSYTATVKVGGSAATAATGTVTFTVNSDPPVSESVVNGVATLPQVWHYAGTASHSITAVYNGDSLYKGSTSSAYAVTVNQIRNVRLIHQRANDGHGPGHHHLHRDGPSWWINLRGAAGTISFSGGVTVPDVPVERGHGDVGRMTWHIQFANTHELQATPPRLTRTTRVPPHHRRLRLRLAPSARPLRSPRTRPGM